MASNFGPPTEGYISRAPSRPAQNVMVIDDRAYKIHTVIVHSFTMGDVDDPILYAAQPLWEWEQSEQGQWVMNHAVESPVWHRQHDALSWGHKFAITAKLKDKDYTFWTLKWNSR